ncbi:hypothetical protein F4824DRAFT_460903 [Ustulina deusta]|nr:hypothetical protein F4824DRAFT_460903 [Ustulina deusta]
MRFLVPVLVGKAAQKHLGRGGGKDKSLVLTAGSLASKPAAGASLIAYFAAGIEGCKSWCRRGAEAIWSRQKAGWENVGARKRAD